MVSFKKYRLSQTPMKVKMLEYVNGLPESVTARPLYRRSRVRNRQVSSI